MQHQMFFSRGQYTTVYVLVYVSWFVSLCWCRCVSVSFFSKREKRTRAEKMLLPAWKHKRLLPANCVKPPENSSSPSDALLFQETCNFSWIHLRGLRPSSSFCFCFQPNSMTALLCTECLLWTVSSVPQGHLERGTHLSFEETVRQLGIEEQLFAKLFFVWFATVWWVENEEKIAH